MTLSLPRLPDESVTPAGPIVPSPAATTVDDRKATVVEVLLALLLNLAFIFALFVHLPVQAPKLKEPTSIPVQLVKPQQAPPKPKLQEQPKPKPQEQPKPPEQPKPQEQQKQQEQPKQTSRAHESGGNDATKAPGKLPKVEAEKAPKPPQVAVKNAQEAPKSEIALPDWMKKLAPGYDLPPAKMTRTAKASSSDEKETSDHPGEGGGDPYLNQMRDQVNANIRYPGEANGAAGIVVFSVTLSRNGSLTGLRLVRSSGVTALDDAAESALRRSAPFRPLPPDYPDPTFITAAIPVYPH